jgi:hypothetical protein
LKKISRISPLIYKEDERISKKEDKTLFKFSKTAKKLTVEKTYSGVI